MNPKNLPAGSFQFQVHGARPGPASAPDAACAVLAGTPPESLVAFSPELPGKPVRLFGLPASCPDRPRPRTAHLRRHIVLALMLAGLLGFVGISLGWFEIAIHRLLISAAGESPARLGLEHYRVGIDALPLADLGKNLSGLTYSPERNSLFTVVNRPAQIAELTLDGRLKRIIPVRGVSDLEGITHMRGDEFFIVDERTQQLILVEIGESRSEIDARNRPRLGLAFDLTGNRGLEGISWDQTGKRLFVVKEKRPLRLFELSGLATTLDEGWLDMQIGEWLPYGSLVWPLRDLSSLTYHEDSGNMLVLSDESRLVVELGPQRRPSGLLVLRRGWHGLKADVPQAEGIAVGPGGEIFVVSEPNLFYRFDPPRTPGIKTTHPSETGER